MSNWENQFLRLPRSLLDSPVIRTLNLYEFRALFRVFLEHQRHAGDQKNGLPVTANDFERAGVRRAYISPTTRVLEALGLLKCARRTHGTGPGRPPNLYLIPFLGTTPRAKDATHDYKRFKTVAEAERAAEAIRRPRAPDPRGVDRLELFNRLRTATRAANAGKSESAARSSAPPPTATKNAS
jgi:hypothetical protein